MHVGPTPSSGAEAGTDPTAWTGRTERCIDELGPGLVRRVAATFDERAPVNGADLPPLWHWAFFHDPAGGAALGTDGHAARGGFLPPAANRQRMWAGSRVQFVQPLRIGREAQRNSTVLEVVEKAGRTGSLLFVTVQHEFVQDGAVAIREEHDIVYREPTPPRLVDDASLPAADWSEPVVPTPTLLFRYSAVTFNGHRIHYDFPYSTQEEGYAGLVVHGPLIATLSLRAFSRVHPDATLRRFSFRGVRPLIAPTPFVVAGRSTGPGRAQLWSGNPDGAAQHATVEFE